MADKDFFISYTGVDQAWAEWIAQTLEQAGHRTVLQAWDFRPGENFIQRMNQALAKAERVLAVWSPAYFDSEYARDEWTAALVRDRGQADRLLPVRVAACQLPPLLATRVYIDLVDLEEKVAAERLCAGVQSGRARPVGKRQFPGVGGPAGAAEARFPGRQPEVRAGGNVTVNPPPEVRSAYLEQVRQIAPRALIDRDAELAELAEFCVAPERGPYVWWRAGAWTGKSALVSWFVLHPPEGVRVVSFFVTARYAGNSDRVAFTEVVSEQLAEALGQSMPPFLTESNREAHLLRMLAEAAEAYQQQNQRLVLVVDGLDEDRGVTTGPDARSIAALLPPNPAGGLRVIVTGRPDPPIPLDVGHQHPLRDPGIVRVLSPSEHAVVVKGDMQRELKHLFQGTRLERDLLGMVTAAGGGLSGSDLAELILVPEVSEYEVAEHLQTVAGRSFTARAARWQPDIAPTGYVLAHEELQQDAARFFGPKRLAGYRTRLHSWAQDYRDRGWPAGTPEYLLRGYYRLLHATSDVPRIVACATDQARHNRMLDITGGDTAALAEITEAQNLILDQDLPPLDLLARLAVHRRRINDRNANIPTNLPALWARLGHPSRAEALANAITDPNQRAEALALVAVTLANTGETKRAQQIARTITNPEQQAKALASMTTTPADPCDTEPIQEVAPDAKQAANAVTEVAPSSQAEAVAIREAYEEAALVAGSGGCEVKPWAREANRLRKPYEQALASVVTAEADASDADRAEQIARAITHGGNPDNATYRLVSVAHTLTDAGDTLRARGVARAAAHTASAITDPYSRAEGLAAAGTALSRTGDTDRAEDLARTAERSARTGKPEWHVTALLEVATVLVDAGEIERARAVARAGEQIARTITSQYGPPTTYLLSVATALVRAGDIGRAQEVARDVEQMVYAKTDMDPASRTAALVSVAATLVDAGDSDWAQEIARAAEETARAITDEFFRATEMVEAAKALADSGDADRAEQVARAIPNPGEQVEALAALATTAARDDDTNRAQRLAWAAGRMADAITERYSRPRALRSAAIALAQAGDIDRAEQVARAIPNPEKQVEALVTLAAAAAQMGDIDRAEQVARAIPNPEKQVEALLALATTAARDNDISRAQELARAAEQYACAIRTPLRLADALAALATALNRADDPEGARAAARAAAVQLASDPGYAWDRDAVLIRVVCALAEVGDTDRAGQTARATTDTDAQAEALLTLASALAGAGDSGAAIHLAAEALSMGNWNGPRLQLLARVDPKAVAAAADEVLGLSLHTRRQPNGE